MAPFTSLFGSTLRGSNASFASDEDETKYLKRIRRLHLARIGVAVTLLTFALVGVGCEGNATDYYFKTAKYADVYLPLWPKELQIGPSVGFIVSSCLVIAGAVGYLIVALLPSPRSRTTILNCLAIAIGLISIVVCAIATTVFIINNNPHEENGTFHGETIHSWTCTWAYSPIHDYNDREAAPEKIDAVKDFARLCAETKVSIAANAVLLAASVVFAMLGSFALNTQHNMKYKRNAAAAESMRGSRETFEKPGSLNTCSTAV